MPTVSFQVVDDKGFIGRFSDPNFWKTYKLYVLREITEKAAEVIRQHASRMWVRPTGALDQSWFTQLDTQAGVGSILNSKPYAYWLNYGVRPHKMVYLLNSEKARDFLMVPQRGGGRRRAQLPAGEKAVVIPLVPGKGQTLFRIATTQQMLRNPGGPPWWHPGIEPKRFLEEGLQNYRDHHLKDDYEGLLIQILGV